MIFELMAPCHFGLEACTKHEITELGCPVTEVTDGRVCFTGTPLDICRANINLRTTERVLLKAADFEAYSWEELFEKTRAVNWEDYLPWDANFYVAKASSVKSRLFSPRDFQTIIQKAIIKRLQSACHREGEHLPMSGEDYLLRVFALKDRIVIGIDTSGESLHRRGYRKMTAKAPITETLAAALLMLTPWRKDRILVDPFCGSGTFCIEAAMMAAEIAPGMRRDFASTGWMNLIPKSDWYRAYDEAFDRAEAVDRKALKERLDIQGYDIDADVLAAARANAENAGVADLIHFQRRDVAMLSHPKKYGFLVTNPPYGERLEDRENLPALYRTIGEQYNRLDSWSMYLITAYQEAEKYIGRKADRNRKVYNGMMKTYFLSYQGAKPGKENTGIMRKEQGTPGTEVL